MRSLVLWHSLVATRLEREHGFTQDEANTALFLNLADSQTAFLDGVTADDYAARLAQNTSPEAPQATLEARQ